MKNNYSLFILLFLISGSISAQQIWDNFQDIRKNDYGFINGTFIPYFENPDKSGVNTSNVAGQYSRNASETFDVLILEAPMADLSDYVSGAKQISIDVWSPNAGVTVQITLENSTLALPANYPTGRHSVYTAVTSVANAWETLTFNFVEQPDASVANDNVDHLVLLFNPNSNTGDTYYFDNINGPELASDPCDGVTANADVFNDFECNQSVDFIFSHSGINFRRVPNPDQTGNTSDYVATYTRNGGEEFDVLIGLFDGNLALEEGSTISIDIWDPAAPSTYRLSLQNANNDVIIAVDQATSTSATWQTLTFDVSSVFESTDISQFVILKDPETFTSGQFYFDNFQFGEPVSTNDLSAFNSLSLFPNPANEISTLSFDLNYSAPVVLNIVDVQGRNVQSSRVNANTGLNQIQISTQALSNGLYFYSLSVDGNSSQGKLIVNH